MKDALLLAGIISLWIVYLLEHTEKVQLQLTLANEQAMAATGPCGHKLMVTGLGKDGKEAAVAGIVMPLSEISRFYTKEVEVDGKTYEEIWEKFDSSQQNHNLWRKEPDIFHFRRPKD